MKVEWQHTMCHIVPGNAGHDDIRHIRLLVACVLRRTTLRSIEELLVQAVVPDAHVLHLLS